MTELEKLAESWWVINKHDVFSLQEAYIAGFRKALEMAAKEVNTPSIYHAICCRVTMESRANNVLQIGEAESK